MRCKVGDLAVIVRDDFPENLGTIVEVFAADEHRLGWWRIRSAGRELALHWTSRIGFLLTGQVTSTLAEIATPWTDVYRAQRLSTSYPRQRRSRRNAPTAGRPQETVREALESIRRELSHES